MQTKSNLVKTLVRQGDYKKALSIAKDFKIGITSDNSNKMKLAYECMVHGTFYKQLGRNIEQTINDGISVLKALYN
ncbi:MAG: hypothetical protein FWG64_02125 [Firmicutes bacterium]|nr:hypothetical protein [Bacillota bacterium]